MSLCQVVQQRRLADTRITTDDQRPASTGTYRGNKVAQYRTLTRPADENVGRILVSWCHRVGPLAASVVGDASP